jgi:lysophospholipase L1-like esterase
VRIALAIAIFVGTAEVLLRVIDPLGLHYYQDASEYFARMRPNPRWGYLHVPNDRFEIDGITIAINSSGMRGPDYPPKADRPRVLILGDSVVFGWGVAYESTFPALLARQLSDVEVISAGVGSWNTRCEREWLATEGLSLAPDLVVLVVVTNDVEPKAEAASSVSKERLKPEIPTWAPSRWQALLRHSHLYQAVAQVSARASAQERLARAMAPSAASREDALMALEEARADCARMGVPLAMVLYGDPQGQGYEGFSEMYGGAAQVGSIPKMSTPQALFKPAMCNSPTDRHLNEKGHQAFATTLMEWIPSLLARHDG